MKKSLFILFFIMFAMNIHSIGYITDKFNEGVHIRSIFMHTDGSFTLILKSLLDDPDSLKNKPNYSLIHAHVKRRDDESHKLVLSLATTAFISGKPVGMYSRSNGTIPFWGGDMYVYHVAELWIME